MSEEKKEKVPSQGTPNLKAKEQGKPRNSGITIGILLIAGGFYLLLVSLFPALEKYNNYLLLFLGIYFLLCYFMFKLHKIFFFAGEVLVVLWVGSLIEELAGSKMLWTLLLLLLGLGMIFYATFFYRRKAEGQRFSARFLVVGSLLVLTSILLILSTNGVFDFSDLLYLMRPIILILFGLVIIQRWFLERKLKRSEKQEIEQETEKQEAAS